MKRIVSAMFAATIALGTTMSGIAPSFAAPLNLPRAEAPSGDVVNVQQRRGYYRQGGRHYYNGQRGYRERRAGYRQHNGWWFPPAAFALGAIVGGAIANQPQYRGPAYRAPVRVGAAHVRWCQNRWRSYRVSDNSYQPFNGPRQVCSSPYS